jgi:uncharacterized protein YegP (UPF0339 family)
MSEPMAKFEIFIGHDRKFYFHLKAENGKIVLESQGYTQKQHALDGIASIKRIAADAEVVDNAGGN